MIHGKRKNVKTAIGIGRDIMNTDTLIINNSKEFLRTAQQGI